MLKHKRIVIGVGGGIAAYKVCEVVSQLFQMGAEVRVILTNSAEQFINPLTFTTLSRHQAYTDADFWQPTRPRPLHIELGEWADLIVIAPLTANTLAKLAYGLADNLLTNTILASRCPVLLAPAMNTEMWEQSTVGKNWHKLEQEHRYHAIGPGEGLLACDRMGAGRMAEPGEIVNIIQSICYTQGRKDLENKRILISAGGTREYLDPVRFLGNPSTGKMGIALAQAAIHRGAFVTLVHAPMTLQHLNSLQNLHLIPVITAEDMEIALKDAFTQADWLIMSAAVADVKPATYSTQKLPKQDLPSSLPLAPVPDLVATLAQFKQPQQLVIGFAAQTGDFVKPALEKLTKKGLDAIAANPIDQPDAGFGTDTNYGVFIDRYGRQEPVKPCNKLELAHKLLDFIQNISANSLELAQ